MAQAALQSVLTDITGANKLEYEDPRWAQLFHSRQILQLRGDEELLEGFALRLIENNLVTGNLMVLLSQTSSRIRQILEKRGTPTPQNLEQCCVSMHFTGLLLNILFSRLGTPDIKKQLSLSADWPAARLRAEEVAHSALPTGDAAVRQILQDVLEVLSVSAPPTWMHDVVFCAANLALCVCSTQLFQADVRDEKSNIFLSYLFATADVDTRNALAPGSRYSIGSTMPAKLVRSLLAHVIAIQASPEGCIVHEMTKTRGASDDAIKVGGGEDEGYLARALRRLLRLDGPRVAHPAKSGNQGASTDRLRCASANPLHEKCLHVLLILLYNRKQSERANPFRDVFCMLFHEDGDGNRDENRNGNSFDDDDEDEESRGGTELVPLVHNQQHRGAGDSAMGVDFQGLAVSVAKTLPSESSSLLLYALLHMHPGFRDYLLESKHIERVLCAVLKGLYASHDAVSVDHLYVLVINVLMMVQDKLLRQTLSTRRARAPWYAEHAPTSWFSLADLTMLCTLRCTLYALFKLKDQYLLSNCFAVMLDLAPFMKNMDCYVSERITKVVCLLAKRGRSAAAGKADRDRDSGEYSPSAEGSSLLPHSGDRRDPAVEQNSRETLLVLLKACSLALRPARRSLNVHLLYALMHEHEKLKEVLPAIGLPADSAAHDPSGCALDAVAAPKEVLALAAHYLDRLKLQETAFVSAVEAVHSLRSLIDIEMQTLAHPEETRGVEFSYAEESGADNFFVPCAWASVIRASPDMGFALSLIRLFHPIEKKLV